MSRRTLRVQHLTVTFTLFLRFLSQISAGLPAVFTGGYGFQILLTNVTIISYGGQHTAYPQSQSKAQGCYIKVVNHRTKKWHGLWHYEQTISYNSAYI